MLARRRLLRYTKNLNLLRRVHLYSASLAGVFIVLHVSYFYSYPLTSAILLGYGSTAMAAFVWLSGTAFLERLRDSLFYHGAMSLSTIGLMVVHSAGAGVNIPSTWAVAILLLVGGVAFFRAIGQISKITPAAGTNP